MDTVIRREISNLVLLIVAITFLAIEGDMVWLLALIVLVCFVLLHELVHVWKNLYINKDEKSLLLLRESIEQLKRDLSFKR